MRPTVHFISGLPRSGSTLLVNLLGQNPDFSVGPTSGVCEILLRVRNEWDQIAEHRAMDHCDSDLRKRAALGALFDSQFWAPTRYRHKDMVSFDKSRTWLGHMEMLEAVYGRAKVIVCVRDLREILASVEVLWRKTSVMRQIHSEREHYHAMQSVAGRLAVWTAVDGMVGLPFNRLVDACRRGYRDRMLFVEYEALSTDPLGVLVNIHEFLEIPCAYRYDPDNVKQLTQEDDYVYDLPGLHDVRRRVRPQAPRWPDILGEFAKPLEASNEVIQQAMRPRGSEMTLANLPTALAQEPAQSIPSDCPN